MISKKCRICRKPNRPYKNTCSIDHEVELGLRLLEKKKRADAKQVRAIDKERKDRLKSRSDWMREAQQTFNAFIRKRDEEQPCICCGRIETKVTGLGAHGWDSGHYRSVGSAPHLRFNENNVHRQLVYCNRYGAGRAVDYRLGLIDRIGVRAVEELEANNDVVKFTIDDLKQIKENYNQKLKELTNRT